MSLVGKTWNPERGKARLTSGEKLELVVGVLAEPGLIDKDTTVLSVAQTLGE